METIGASAVLRGLASTLDRMADDDLDLSFEAIPRPRRAEYTATDFVAMREANTLTLTPKFQRNPVWQPRQQSYFIDSIIRGIPIPPILMREVQRPTFDGVIREVIDGQQRLRAILDFIDGQYALSKSLEIRVGGKSQTAAWAGKRFSNLASTERQQILNYYFSVEVFVQLPDRQVLEIFARLNSYSVQLNKQELRNGTYFGEFKQLATSLSHEYLDTWRAYKVFSEQAIARMMDVELTSELLILLLDGVQDKKKSIDDFYRTYDDEFDEADRCAKLFSRVMTEIAEAVGDDLANTAFRRVPMFYSLFAAVAARHTQVNGLDTAPSGTGKLTLDERNALRQTVIDLSRFVEMESRSVPKSRQEFVIASSRQTDNRQPRVTRIETIIRDANL